MLLEYLPYIFFLIALFYSSVGFGGGSSYLAILSLVLPDFYEIRSTALILNICVVSIGTFFVHQKPGAEAEIIMAVLCLEYAHGLSRRNGQALTKHFFFSSWVALWCLREFS